MVTTYEKNQERVVGASEDGTCTAVCLIEFFNGQTYQEEGVASPKTVNSRLRYRLIEMAHTRAFCRTASLATGKGLVSAEEIRFRAEEDKATEPVDDATLDLRVQVQMKMRALKLREAEITMYLSTLGNTTNVDGLNADAARRVLEALDKKMAEKKAEEKKDEASRQNDQGSIEVPGTTQEPDTDERKTEPETKPHQLQPNPDGTLPLPVASNKGDEKVSRNE